MGSPSKAMRVWKYRPVLFCKHLIFRHALPGAIICNMLKLLTPYCFVGPTELLDKIRIEFFSEPIQAAYKAIEEA